MHLLTGTWYLEGALFTSVVKPESTVTTMSATIRFEDSKPFAEGRFRLAYRGVYLLPLQKSGQQCVVKRKRDTYVWSPNGWDLSVKIQREAQALARDFNQHNQTRSILTGKPASYSITFANIDKGIITSGQFKNEYAIYEDYLDGEYKKWVGNNGFISPKSSLLPAFAHWSWVHTGGERMIADLQGVYRPDLNSYLLTDPVILSVGQQYGCTDLGIEGMSMFFLNHVCSEFCSFLPMPTLNDIARAVPQLHLDRATLLLQQLQDHTTFSHEQKFSPEIRTALIPVFKQIATSNK